MEELKAALEKEQEWRGLMEADVDDDTQAVIRNVVAAYGVLVNKLLDAIRTGMDMPE